MKKNIVISLCVLMFSFFLVAPAFAQTAEGATTQGNKGDGATKCPNDTVCINNPLQVDSPQELIGYVINNILGIVGSLALVMFVFGGIIWMTSSGSADKIKKGRDILIWSIIGLVVIFSAYALVRFVIQGVGA